MFLLVQTICKWWIKVLSCQIWCTRLKIKIQLSMLIEWGRKGVFSCSIGISRRGDNRLRKTWKKFLCSFLLLFMSLYNFLKFFLAYQWFMFLISLLFLFLFLLLRRLSLNLFYNSFWSTPRSFLDGRSSSWEHHSLEWSDEKLRFIGVKWKLVY